MNPFRYLEANDSGGAVALLTAEPKGKFLAGGTTLLDLMKLDVEKPEALVDLNQLQLTQIRVDDDGLFVGALATNADLAAHPIVREKYPLISRAILAGASPQLRNMATTGGNLLQRTRCDYFRNAEQACNKRAPGSGCAAMEGIHKAHAIFGTSEHCIATYPGDMAIALIALDTIVFIEGPQGTRSVNLSEFHLEPGSTPNRETVLERDEMVTGIRVAQPAYATHCAYVKVRDRASYEFALASAAVAVDFQNGVVRDARIALGGIATRPWRSHAAEKALAGNSDFEAAARAALAGAHPRRDNAYKVELAQRALVEALRQATEGVKS